MKNFLVIILSFLGAIMLTISTFPLGVFSPDWIQLFLIYWLIAAPFSVGILSSWLIGLLVDVVMGSTLGANALAYIVVSYLVTKIYKTLRNFTVIQQGIVIFLILILKFTIILWIDKLLNIQSYDLSIYWISLISGIIWPFIFFGLRIIRRRYNVS